MNERIDRAGEGAGIVTTIFVSTAITVALCVLNYCVHVPNPDAILLVAIVFFSLVYGYAGGITSGIVTIGYTLFYYSNHSGGSISVTESNFEKIVVMIVAIIFMVIMVGMLKKKFDRKNQELMDSNNKLQALVTIDPLTGLSNRRALDDIYEMYMAQAIRNKQPISCIITDIDDFKQINDTFGHLKGDEALASLGKLLKETIRKKDFAARYGGEEFSVILPECSNAEALAIAENLRQIVAASKFPDNAGGNTGRITASQGVATYDPLAMAAAPSPEQIIASADKALYQAKQGGRNLVVNAALVG